MRLYLGSVALAGASAMLAVAAGLLVAVAWLRGGRIARGLLAATAVATLALPSFLVANAWLALTTGWRSAGGASGGVPGPGMVAMIQGLQYWPLTAVLAVGAATRMDPALLELDPQLRGWALFRRVVGPAWLPAISTAAAITFTLALSSFTVPVLFQVPVFTEVLWVRFNTRLDTFGALRAAVPVVFAAGLLVACLRGRPVAWPRPGGPVSVDAWRRALGLPGRLAAGASVPVGVLSLGLPLADLLARPRTWTELPGALAAGRAALAQSVGTALAATALAAGLAVLLAGTGPVRRPRWTWLAFLVPGLLAGIAALAVFNRPSFRWFHPGVGVPVLLLGLRHLAPLWAATAGALLAVDPAWSDAVRSAGGRRRDVWRLALLPGAGRSLVAAAYAVYLLCLWDVETTVLVAPPGGETLALRIFNLLHYGYSSQVHALCLVLLAVALAPLGLVAGIRWLVGHRGRIRSAAGVVGCLGLVLVGPGCRPAPDGRGTELGSVTFAAVEIIGSRGVAPGQFNKPRSVACDREDNLYVADFTGRIQRFAPDGRFVLQWQMPETERGKPKGLGIDADGNLIVVEPHYMRVNHFTPDGVRVAQWGGWGTNEGQFVLPRAVALGPDGDHYLSEYTLVDRVQRFGPARPGQGGTPAFRSAWGRPGTGPGEFNRAEGLDVGPDGLVHVADSCNHRVQVFTADGQFVRAHGRAGSAPGEYSYPYDVRVDREGNQFVCEFGNSRITVLDPRGGVVEVVGRAGSGPGEFANPWSIALDSRGNLYVADSRNHRVQKLVRRQPLAGPGGGG